MRRRGKARISREEGKKGWEEAVPARARRTMLRGGIERPERRKMIPTISRRMLHSA